MIAFERADYFHDASISSDPYAYWDFVREQGPVWREPHHDVALIARYDDVVSVYRDNDSWSACNTVAGLDPFPVPLEGDDISALIDAHRDEIVFSRELPAMDPPQHTEHRALVMRLLTPRRLQENEDFMWRLADRQIDEVLGRSSCDFVGDFAQPFTALIIADLLGVPEEDRATFREEALGRKREAYETTGDGVDQLVADPFAFMHDRFTRYVEDRRRTPRGDVLTALATATFPDGRLPDVQTIVVLAAQLFGAGQETTVHLLSACLRRIAEEPELQGWLREDRGRIPGFIEEVLRLDSPLKGPFRLSKVPTQVGGVELPAGTTAMLLTGAANRDPRKFESPNEFRPTRPEARQHLAFGYGIHSCLGAPLARAEVRIGIERLFDRSREIRICEARHGPPGARHYEYLPNYMIRGMQQLQLEIAPAD